MRGKEHEALMGAVGELLEECDMAPADIGRVICGAGPGSFTSLRIAAAVAKGICVATGAPLVPISSLALLMGSAGVRPAGRYLVAVDAMRSESYVQEFTIDDSDIHPASDSHRVIATQAIDQLAAECGAVVLGPARLGDALVMPHARGAGFLTNMIHATSAADLASWEPSYGRLAEAQVKWEAAHGRALESV